MHLFFFVVHGSSVDEALGAYLNLTEVLTARSRFTDMVYEYGLSVFLS